MLRHDMVETVGKEFLTSNIEAGEYSYVQAAGGKAQLEAKVGHPVSHFKLDIRFEMEDVVVLIETKQNYDDDDDELEMPADFNDDEMNEENYRTTFEIESDEEEEAENLSDDL